MHRAPSGTTTISSTNWRAISKVMSPARATAVPSAKPSMRGRVTGCPASRAARIEGAPSGSTPMTFTSGWNVCSQIAVPARSPPPPTGTTTAAGGSDACSKISLTTVPWPAIVRGSSKGWT